MVQTLPCNDCCSTLTYQNTMAVHVGGLQTFFLTPRLSKFLKYLLSLKIHRSLIAATHDKRFTLFWKQ